MMLPGIRIRPRRLAGQRLLLTQWEEPEGTVYETAILSYDDEDLGRTLYCTRVLLEPR